MKKLVLFFIILTLFTSCNSDKSIIKGKIEEEILKNTNDPKSYEFVEMSDVKKIANKDYFDDLKFRYRFDEEKAKAADDVYKILYKDSKDSVFVCDFKFRAANGFGAKILSNYVFALNKNYEIIDIRTN